MVIVMMKLSVINPLKFFSGIPGVFNSIYGLTAALMVLVSCTTDGQLSYLTRTQFIPTYMAKDFGLYFWHKTPGCGYECALRKEINLLGAIPGYVLYFTDLSRPFPENVYHINARYGIRTVLTQDLKIYGQADDDGILDSIISGKWDEYFLNLAKRAREYGDNFYYRFGYEMNGDWFPWGGKPAAFKKAWSHVHGLFVSAGVREAQWVFSPNVLYNGSDMIADLSEYYPGDSLVNVIGADGYNFGGHDSEHDWQAYPEVFFPTIFALRARYPHKRFWICEVGSAPGDKKRGQYKSAWLQDFLVRFHADPGIEMFIWFNEDKTYAGEANWRLDSDTATLGVFRDWVNTQLD